MLKNRTLAEGERAESPITRALQKFLPMLLDRVEATFSDLTLYIHFADTRHTTACITLSKFSTNSKTLGGVLATPKPHRDLSKIIVASGISVRLTVDEQPVFHMQPGGFVINLAMRDGAYDIDIDFPEAIRLNFDPAASSFVRDAQRRAAVWATAFRFGRPPVPLAQDVKAWFQYSAAAVVGRLGRSRTALTIEKCRQVIASCAEYRRLHVLRLRRKDEWTKEDEDKIEEIEDCLDADMILFLRARARADVLAEEVSAFATKDWLSWALFGYNMSEERKHLAAEIRKSLLVAEQAEHDEIEGTSTAPIAKNTGTLSRGWTKANIKLVLPTVSVKLARQKDNLGALLVKMFEVQAEVDSSMHSYSLSSKLAELIVSDGDKKLLCQEQQKDLAKSSDENFIEAKLFKPAVDNVIKLDIRIAPSAIHLDIGRVSRYVEVVRFVQTLRESSSGIEMDVPLQRNCEMAATQQSKTPRSDTDRNELVITTTVPQFRFCISKETVPQPGKSGKLLTGALCVRDIRLKAQDALNVPRVRASCFASLSVCSEFTTDKTSSDITSGCAGLEDAERSLLPLLISGKVVTETVGDYLALTLDDLHGHMALIALEDASVSVSEGMTTLRDEFSAIANDSPQCRRQYRGSHVRKDPAALAKLHLNVTSIDFFIQRDESESRGKIILSTRGLHVDVNSSSTSVTLADELCIYETKFGAKLSVSSVPTLDYVAKAEVIFSAEEVPSELDVRGAYISLVANPDSLVEVVSSFQGVKMIVRKFLSSQSEDSSGQAAVPMRVSVVLDTVELVPCYRESCVFLRFRGAHFVDCGDVVSGSLVHPELTDKSGLSGYHDVAIRSVAETMSLPRDERSVTFTITPNAVSIHLFALQVTVLRSLAERLIGLRQAFTDAVNLATRNHAPLHEKTAAQPYSSSSDRKVICIQGSDLCIRLPSPVHHSHSVAFNTTQLTMTMSTGSVAVSIRKLSILTKTRRFDTLVDAALSPSKPEGEVEWVVLVRGLDLDVSRNSKDESVESGALQQVRSELEIQLLSKASLFVSPSQVRLFKGIYHSSQSSISPQLEARTQTAQEESKAADTPFFPVKDHAILKIETQQISVELINEDHDGSVVSTIAGLEVDPVRFHQKTLRDEPRPGTKTEVTQWNLESFKLKLSDRSSDVLPQLREVIRSGEDGLKYFPRSTDDSQQQKPCVFIESVYRMDDDGMSKSSVDIRLQNLLLVPSPVLFEKLFKFFRQCASSADKGRAHEADVEFPRRISRGDIASARFENDQKRSDGMLNSDTSPQTTHDPIRKVSISWSNSLIQVFGRGRRVGESSVLIRAGLIKAVLLHDRCNNLVQGSQIRLRDARLSTIWLPSTTVRAERAFNGLVDQLGTQNTNQDPTSARFSLGTSKRPNLETNVGSSWRHSLAVPREKFRWNFFRQASETYTSDHIVFIRSAVLRFPVRESARLVLVVSSVSVDTRIRLILRFAYILSVANLLPSAEEEEAFILPPIQVAINNINISAQTPLSSERNTAEVDPGNYAMIRIRGTFNGLVAKNLSAISGSLKVAADVMDKRSGIRDQIIAPSILDFEAHGYEALSLSFSSSRLIRAVISPLTARAITSIILNVLPLPGKSHAQKSEGAKSIEVGFLNSSESAVRLLHISLSLQGVVLCCVAEEPRVQLLRLVLRHIESEISAPLTSNGIGNLFFSLQDIVLEDTISWRLYADEVNDEGARWSNIFAGTEGIPGSGVVTRVPRSQSLIESMRTLLIGSTTEAESPPRGLANRPANGYVTSLQQNAPLLRYEMSWQPPADHIAAHIQLRGIEFNLNMSILPGLLEWMESVREAAKDVRDAHLKRFSSSSTESQSQELESDGRIGIDHVVIEPFKIGISVKAPPRRIQETALRRSLMWLFGSEQVLGLTLHTSHVVVSGDFDTTDRLVQRLRTIYLSSFSSKLVGRQLFWQTSSFVQLARVAATSILRRRHSGYSFLSSSSERRQGPGHHASLGLLDAIRDAKVAASTCVRTTATASTSIGSTSTRSTCQDQAEKEIETLDITCIIEPAGGT